MRNLIFLLLFLGGIISPMASPEIKENTIISDMETEDLLLDLLTVAFKSMDIPLKPKVFIVVNGDINAAATYGGIIFIHTGMITECTHVGQLFAVLLHEAGHVGGGHLARLDAAAKQAMVPAIASTLIGGVATLISGNPTPLMAGAAGGMQVFDRGIKKHTRGEEENADSAALKALGKNSIWLVELLNMIDRKTHTAIDLYTSTHPLTPDRINTAKEYAERNKDKEPLAKMPEDAEIRFQFIKAKILAYTKKPQLAAQHFPPSNTSASNQYGRAIYMYRLRQFNDSRKILEKLTTENPENVYITELMAQMDFQQGHTEKAAEGYKKALDKKPSAHNLKILLAQALIDGKNFKAEAENIIRYLTQALDQTPENAFAWRLLSRAYGKNNQLSEAAACLAEEAMLTGDAKMAEVKAKEGSKSSNQALAKRSKDILESLKSA
jgi:predicted Zn-dependent protease